MTRERTFFKPLTGPTDYCARMARPSVKKSQYLHELSNFLYKDIDIFWTGPEIVSEKIPTSTIKELEQVLKRKPLIWDNFHANDYDIRRVYLGPFMGRPSSLRTKYPGFSLLYQVGLSPSRTNS